MTTRYGMKNLSKIFFRTPSLILTIRRNQILDIFGVKYSTHRTTIFLDN